MPSAHRSHASGRVSCALQAVEEGRRRTPEITLDELVQRILKMFTGGERGSGPTASGDDQAASEASDGLLVDAIKMVMKGCVRQGRRLCGNECAVHVQCYVDKEEMLGYPHLRRVWAAADSVLVRATSRRGGATARDDLDRGA